MIKFLVGVIAGMYVCEMYGYTFSGLLENIEIFMEKESKIN